MTIRRCPIQSSHRAQPNNPPAPPRPAPLLNLCEDAARNNASSTKHRITPHKNSISRIKHETPNPIENPNNRRKEQDYSSLPTWKEHTELKKSHQRELPSWQRESPAKNKRSSVDRRIGEVRRCQEARICAWALSLEPWASTCLYRSDGKVCCLLPCPSPCPCPCPCCALWQCRIY